MTVCLFEDKTLSSDLYKTGFQRGLKQTREDIDDIEVLKKLFKLAAKERRRKEL